MNLQWAYQLAITLIIGIIAYLLKDMKKVNDEKHAETRNEVSCVKDALEKVEQSSRQELEKMKDEFNQFKSEMPLVYVLRDDFIRAMGNFEKKLDKIYELLSQKRKEE